MGLISLELSYVINSLIMRNFYCIKLGMTDWYDIVVFFFCLKFSPMFFILSSMNWKFRIAQIFRLNFTNFFQNCTLGLHVKKVLGDIDCPKAFWNSITCTTSMQWFYQIFCNQFILFHRLENTSILDNGKRLQHYLKTIRLFNRLFETIPCKWPHILIINDAGRQL